MRILNATIINPGIRIGRVKHLRQKQYKIPKTTINKEDINAELQNLADSLEAVALQINLLLEDTQIPLPDQEIIRSHLLILQDPELYNRITDRIKNDLYSAAYAVQQVFQVVVEEFELLENDFFAQKSVDYKDVANRLLGKLLGENPDHLEAFSEDDIVFVKEMSPSRIINLSKSGVKAYVSESGSHTCHSAILSRALGIIALTNVEDIFDIASANEVVIVDGINSLLICDPDFRTLEQYGELISQAEREKQELEAMRSLSPITITGSKICLYVNIELPDEVDKLIDLGCDGIGLFRTEFLYLSRNSLPNEAEQTEIYSKVLKAMYPLPVTFRTFDLGGDKLSHILNVHKEENPNLGCRGIRFSLSQKELFRSQLRAIFRASPSGKANIMFPMITGVEDFAHAKAITLEVIEQLKNEESPFDPKIPIGLMIEIPSAALVSSKLAQMADFFSIGTNDLVQYTLAADRNNDAVSEYYLQHHPAVLELIRFTVSNAKKRGIPCSVCGEMASTPEYIPLLIGMGINCLSVCPSALLRTKAIIRKCDDQLMDWVFDALNSANLKTIEDTIYNRLSPYYHF